MEGPSPAGWLADQIPDHVQAQAGDRCGRGNTALEGEIVFQGIIAVFFFSFFSPNNIFIEFFFQIYSFTVISKLFFYIQIQ